MHVYFLEQKGPSQPAELDGIKNVLDFKFLLSKSKEGLITLIPPPLDPAGPALVESTHSTLFRDPTLLQSNLKFSAMQLVKGSRNAQLLAA